MIKIPLTVCLMTTTKGHFGIKTRYRQTLESFNSYVNFHEYEKCLANIKISNNEDAVFNDMKTDIQTFGFDVLSAHGEWSHNSESHHINYIYDCLRVLNSVKTEYVFMLEDDWLLNVPNGDYLACIRDAISLLENNPHCMQIRLARYNNEYERILGLKKKHNLDKFAKWMDKSYFMHNDFSMNPSFYRTRDLRAALVFTLNAGVPKHIEHGVGLILGLLSQSAYPFACLNPENVNIGHTGTIAGQEDNISQPIIAT